MLYKVAYLVAVIWIVNTAETARIKTMYDGYVVYQDVTVDPDSNTMLIVVADENPNSDLKTTVNLHDFNADYVAMKSISDKVCLLKPLDEEDKAGHLSSNAIDIVNGENVLKKLKPMYWDRDPHPMEYGEVLEEAGENLAEFCRNYKTYILVPKELGPGAREIDTYRRCSRTNDVSETSKALRGLSRVKRARCWVCFFCLNYVDGFEGDVVDTGEKPIDK